MGGYLVWIAAIIALAAGILIGYLVRRAVGETKIKSAETEAKRILDEATKAGETRKKEMLVEARDEIQKLREELEREVRRDGRRFRRLNAGSSQKRRRLIDGRSLSVKERKTSQSRRKP